MAKAQKKKTQKASKLNAEALEEMSHIGERLKAVREDNKLDLSAVAEELMIRRFYLQAIEDGNFKELPAPVYAIGFIKNYSEFLGFDPESAVAEFKREAYGTKRQTSPELVFPDPMTTSVIPTKAAMFAGAGFFVLILVLGLIFALPDKGEVAVEIPEAPVVASEPEILPPEIVSPIDSTTIEQAPEIIISSPVEGQENEDFLILPETSPSQDTTVTPSQEEVTLTVENKVASRVTITAVQTSWIEVADAQGNIVLSRILKAGETYEVPQGKGMKMITGNAGGVRLTLDGQELPKLGSVGDVRRNLSLNPDDLQQIFNLN